MNIETTKAKEIEVKNKFTILSNEIEEDGELSTMHKKIARKEKTLVQNPQKKRKKSI